jgi:hypothetical protein
MDSTRANVRRWVSAQARALVGALAALCLAAPALAGTSTDPSPEVVFDSTGFKTVTLSVCNGTQCTQTTQTVHVYDPTPVIITSVVMTPLVQVPTSVQFFGEGTGKPALTYRWHVQRVFACTAVEVATLNGASVFWSTAGLPAGSYAAVLDLTNGNGTTVSSLAQPFTVTPDPATLLDDGFEDPCSTPWSFSSAAMARP